MGLVQENFSNFLAALKRLAYSVYFWFTLLLLVYIALVALNFLYILENTNIYLNAEYSIASDFLIGGILSFIFYFIFVKFPEEKKRKLIKSSLKRTYLSIKNDNLHYIIAACRNAGRYDLSYSTDTAEELLTPEGFRKAFDGGREGDEGFYAFRNGIDSDCFEYRKMMVNFRLFAEEINYLLHNYQIDDEKLFGYFKGLQSFLFELSISKYEDVYEKVFTGFIYESYAGWSMMKGYLGYDLIIKKIDEL